MKRDQDEETHSVAIFEQIINRLSNQLEEQSVAMDTLKQNESSLKLSLRLAEQRTMEAETEKAMLQERSVCVWCEMGICMYVCETEKAMLQERSVCVWCEMGICMYVCETEKAMLQERSVCVWCEMGICMYVCETEKAMLQERSVCVWCEMGICMYVCEMRRQCYRRGQCVCGVRWVYVCMCVR